MTKEINKEELLVQQEYIEKVKAINAKREQMPLAHVHSFGCQQNVSDGEKIKGMLAQMGYGFTPETAFADLILFNTCAVRENAEDRVFGNIGALKKLKEKNKTLSASLDKAKEGSVLKRLEDAKLRQDYEAALKTLDSIPPEVIRFYENRTQEPAMRHDK